MGIRCGLGGAAARVGVARVPGVRADDHRWRLDAEGGISVTPLKFHHLARYHSIDSRAILENIDSITMDNYVHGIRLLVQGFSRLE